MDYFCIRVVAGQHVVGYTTDGIDWYPLPRATFGDPRAAIAYADMRQAHISPLRSSAEVATHPSVAASAESLRGDSAGSKDSPAS